MQLPPDVMQKLLDLNFFASNFFKLRTKDGSIVPFRFNRAQQYLHQRLQAQLEATGRVRAVVLKGRQQGCSTYVQARYFHRAITSAGYRAYILTHETEATKNLFGITKRYYDNLPEGLCPRADRDTQDELIFDKTLGSSYGVGTARNRGAGRSQTIQLLHGCLAAGTLIVDPISGAARPIESFQTDDLILTHNNNIAAISYISGQQKKCLSVKFRGLTAFPLLATKEHKFFTKNGWVELKYLKSGDSIGYPIKEISGQKKTYAIPKALKRLQNGGSQHQTSDEINLNYEFGLICGLYLADGHLKLQAAAPYNASHIEFAIHRKETERTLKWLKPFEPFFSSIAVKDRENCLTTTVTCYGSRMGMLFNELLGRTENKHYPIDWHLYPAEFMRGMLHGYICGDGASYANDRRIRASSILMQLTLTTRDIAASLGYGWASIERKEAGIRHGRNEKERFTFALCGEGATRLATEIEKPSPIKQRKSVISTKGRAASTTVIENGYAWVRINSIDDAGMKTVYDFEVNHDDHSYCTIHGATHNSECAFWEHAQEHATGLLQAVGNAKGTEIILESTANGIGNYFYNMWRQASSGESDWQAIFLPWYWQDEYKDYSKGFVPTEEENELLAQYGLNGLTKEHLSWRRKKIADFGYDWDAGVAEFRQEFPFTATEAFRNPVDDIFINAQYVQRARKNDVYSESALVIGVDPAIGDNDRCVITRRKGRVAYNVEILTNHNTMELAGRLKHIIELERPHRVFIDCIGIGAGTTDRLREMGFSNVVGVNVARSANDKIRFGNLRAELWWEMRDWFYQNELPVQIPDSDELEQDLCGLGYKYRSNGQLLIESKEDAKKRGLRSPDLADSLMLTFSEGQMCNNAEIVVQMRPAHHNSMFT